MPLLNVSQSLTEDGRLQIEVVNSSGYDATRAANVNCWSSPNQSSRSALYCEEEQPCSIIFALRASHPHLLYYQGIDDMENGHRCKPMRTRVNTYRHDDISTLISAGSNTARSSAWGGEKLYRSPTQTLLSSSNENMLQSISDETWAEFKCSRNSKVNRNDCTSETLHCDNNNVTQLGECNCVNDMIDNRPRLIREELPDGILLPGERRVLVLDIDDPEYMEWLMNARTSEQQWRCSSSSLCTDDPFSPHYTSTPFSDPTNTRDSNGACSNNILVNGNNNNNNASNIFEESPHSSYSQTSTSASISTYDVLSPSVNAPANNEWPTCPMSTTTTYNNNNNNNNNYKNSNTPLFSSREIVSGSTVNNLNNRLLNNMTSTYSETQAQHSLRNNGSAICVPVTNAFTTNNANTSDGVGRVQPSIYIYYERLGDDDKCVDAARKWLINERSSYTAWQNMYIKSIVRLEKKKQECTAQKRGKAKNVQSNYWKGSVSSNMSSNAIVMTSSSDGIHNNRCHGQVPTCNRVIPINGNNVALSKSSYRRIIPPVLGTPIRWRRDNQRGTQATKVATVVESIDVAALSYWYYYGGSEQDGQTCNYYSHNNNSNNRETMEYYAHGAQIDNYPVRISHSLSSKQSSTNSQRQQNSKTKLPASYESTHKHSLSISAQKMFNMNRVGGGMVIIALNLTNNNSLLSATRPSLAIPPSLQQKQQQQLMQLRSVNSRSISLPAQSQELAYNNANGEWAGNYNHNLYDNKNNISTSHKNNIISTKSYNVNPSASISNNNMNTEQNSYSTNKSNNPAITLAYNNNMESTSDAITLQQSNTENNYNKSKNKNNTSTSAQNAIVVANDINRTCNNKNNNNDSVSVSQSKRDRLAERSVKLMENTYKHNDEENISINENIDSSRVQDSASRVRPGRGLALLDAEISNNNVNNNKNSTMKNTTRIGLQRLEEKEQHQSLLHHGGTLNKNDTSSNKKINLSKNNVAGKNVQTSETMKTESMVPNEARLIAERTYYQYNYPNSTNSALHPNGNEELLELESASRPQGWCLDASPLSDGTSGKVFSPVAWTGKRSVLRSNANTQKSVMMNNINSNSRVDANSPPCVLVNDIALRGTAPSSISMTTLPPVVNDNRYYNVNPNNGYYATLNNPYASNTLNAAITPAMSRSSTDVLLCNSNNSVNSDAITPPTNTSFIGGLIHFDRWDDWRHMWSNALKESRNALEQLLIRWRTENDDIHSSANYPPRTHDDLCSSASMSTTEMDNSITNPNFTNNVRWMRRFSWLPTLERKQPTPLKTRTHKSNTKQVSQPPFIVIGFIAALIALLDVIASVPEFVMERFGFVWNIIQYLLNVIIGLCPTVLNTSVSFVKDMILVDSNVSVMRLVFMPVCVLSTIGIMLFVIWSLLFVDSETYTMYNTYW